MNLFSLGIAITALIVSAIFARHQVRAAERSNALQLVIDLFREFRSPQFKESLRYIRNELAGQCPPEQGFPEEPSAAQHVNRVSHYMSDLGLLVAYGIIEDEIIIAGMGGSVIDAWTALRPYIEAERRRRGGLPYQMFFEVVANMAADRNQTRLMHEALNPGLAERLGIRRPRIRRRAIRAIRDVAPNVTNARLSSGDTSRGASIEGQPPASGDNTLTSQLET